MTAAAIRPELAQRRAADPGASVWVSASAGTGKTKVLTDRVLGLLLAGTAAHRILCLTFTKAAAAEMATRIAARLAAWSTAADGDLDRALTELLGRAPDAATAMRARRLFAQVLDAPGGMKIQTIHGFCQSLLRRFPLEAGLAPHFAVMDDRDAAELLDAAYEDVLTRARRGDDAGLAAALAEVTARVHETHFPDLMQDVARERGRLRRMIARDGGLAGLTARIRHHLGLERDETADSILAAACDDAAFDAAACRAAAAALATGGKTDSERAASMTAWLGDPTGRVVGFARYGAALLTKDHEPRAKLCSNGVRDGHPGVEEALLAEALRLVRVMDRWKAAQVAEATAALLTLGEALLVAYDRHKARAALLDYDDLILAARRLMGDREVVSWVLFKLDGGIDHVLVDEAQDTNPDQWAVVKGLTEEFFAGEGAQNGVRTVFAVGDSKQSIYSFQRADPRAAEEMRLYFARRAAEAGCRWDEVPLQVSFRSTAAVLDAVDRVFTTPAAQDGVAEADGYHRHISWRQGQAGLVELWPPVEPRPADEPEPWKPPVERAKGDSPRTRLARLIARRIHRMVTGGERLDSQNRPIGPGDVMVLVRRRGGFVEDLVRELKALEVAVAGADRMVLTEQMAVMDLMALGNFLLLPDDDLTLASVLKSPLIGLNEDQLFALAYPRGRKSLWAALTERAGERPYDEAYRALSDLLARADFVPPHELFAHVLGPCGGKHRLLGRLGYEAEDPIDEFMALTLAFERAHPPSLQAFLHWLDSGAVEIKRDLETAPGAVRIMTVHGSKGLQAPIVFLPDTLQAPGKGARLLWPEEGADELVLWPPRTALQDPASKAARAAAEVARDREYRRLLYVAMTRAEDRLYVCGWRTQRTAEGCWYDLVGDALAGYAHPADDAFLAEQGETGSGVLRLACAQTVEAPEKVAEESRAETAALPGWARRAAPLEPSPPRPLAPSRPEGEEPPVRSPCGTDGAARYQRGKLIHRLLQTLPDLPPARRAEAAARFLSRPGWGLDVAAQAELAGEVAMVLSDPAFAAVFAPGSRAEVPLVGMVGERVLSGQVDRLAVTEGDVLIVDFKTNRRPPKTQDDVAPAYLRQMAAYRMALACIYPGKTIRCALLWTDGPVLMPLDPGRLDDALAGLLDTAS